MRQFEDVAHRWSALFNTSIGVDLRQAIRDDDDFDPCEDGLRSVCWKVFLLHGPLSKASWTKKVKDSRSAYTSLRDHFLKYIDNPNDLHSSADPLADDESSPWATLRQDETNREEIWQDVIRCNVDNYFFREPSTQRKLLDILFIYSKLNPDTGYRQGMHELLAPVLWAVSQDSIDVQTVPTRKADEEGADFMLNVLNSRYVEHDAFNIFCAIMQTVKTFYELGDSKDSSAIVTHSERIHKELLGAVDPDLCHHLQVVGIVPQIFAIRWLRLLFGREFDFKDVLKLWDILFAENLNIEIIDMVCVAILLRMRWQLIDADYTSAITALTRLNLPKDGDSARAIVRDASVLTKRKTPEAGAEITQLRTGRRQYVNPLSSDEPIHRVSTPQSRGHRRLKSQQASPSPSPARFSTPQRQLEGLFSNVSSNLQKGAEGWSVQNVSKAFRGAVGEARRNIEQLQASHSRSTSVDIPRNNTSTTNIATGTSQDPATIQSTGSAADLEARFRKLEERNKALAAMLDTAQETLRKWKAEAPQQEMHGEDAFNTALARIQFVAVYLADSDIPIPPVSSPAVEKKQEQTLERSSEKHEPLKLESSTAAIAAAPPGTEAQHYSELQLQSQSQPQPSETETSVLASSLETPEPPSTSNTSTKSSSTTQKPVATNSSAKPSSSQQQPSLAPAPPDLESPNNNTNQSLTSTSPPPQPTKSTTSAAVPPSRPSLAESSFSFMLGEDRHRTSLSFIRSKPVPEEARSQEAAAAAAVGTGNKSAGGGSEGKGREKKGDTAAGRNREKDRKKERRGSAVKRGGGESDEDGFTMSTLL